VKLLTVKLCKSRRGYVIIQIKQHKTQTFKPSIMASTATARPSTKRVSSSTKTNGTTKSNNTGLKSAAGTRSNVSSKPGKSGQAPQATKAKAGAPTSANREIPKPTIKEMKSLHALGVSMTNIHRIVQQKPGLKAVRYYDVWKVLRSQD
jgi:hypothetical protein